MKSTKETFRLLKEYGRLGWVVWNLSLTGMFLVLIFILGSEELVYFCLFPLVMACWEISDVYLYEERDKLKKDLADTLDKLCLAEHEAEQLAIDLDAAQAAVKIERRRREQEARMKEPAIETEPASVETAPVEASKPKPKRKPASKRKPKTNETKDENQN